MIRLEKTDHTRNLKRFYEAFIVPSLFGEWTVFYKWGRIGSGSQIRMRTVETLEEAKALVKRKLQDKERRGYQMIV